MPASRGESADEALASPVGVCEHRTATSHACECERCAIAREHTELMGNLNRYTMKALQQSCRDLHIKIGGTKEEVVRRITTHKLQQECVQRGTSGATSGSMSMSQHSNSEG
jgi:hypothetical protein